MYLSLSDFYCEQWTCKLPVRVSFVLRGLAPQHADMYPPLRPPNIKARRRPQPSLFLIIFPSSVQPLYLASIAAACNFAHPTGTPVHLTRPFSPGHNFGQS